MLRLLANLYYLCFWGVPVLVGAIIYLLWSNQ